MFVARQRSSSRTSARARSTRRSTRTPRWVVVAREGREQSIVVLRVGELEREAAGVVGADLHRAEAHPARRAARPRARASVPSSGSPSSSRSAPLMDMPTSWWATPSSMRLSARTRTSGSAARGCVAHEPAQGRRSVRDNTPQEAEFATWRSTTLRTQPHPTPCNAADNHRCDFVRTAAILAELRAPGNRPLRRNARDAAILRHALREASCARWRASTSQRRARFRRAGRHSWTVLDSFVRRWVMCIAISIACLAMPERCRGRRTHRLPDSHAVHLGAVPSAHAGGARARRPAAGRASVMQALAKALSDRTPGCARGQRRRRSSA